jgi:hypothetical protein
MNITITLIASSILLITKSAFSQMSDGKYVYNAKEVTLELSITDGGWTISSASVTDNTTKKTSTGKGVYRSASGAEWYEFQTAECNYDFDAPTGKLILSQFDCKNGQKDVKYTLTKK